MVSREPDSTGVEVNLPPDVTICYMTHKIIIKNNVNTAAIGGTHLSKSIFRIEQVAAGIKLIILCAMIIALIHKNKTKAAITSTCRPIPSFQKSSNQLYKFKSSPQARS